MTFIVPWDALVSDNRKFVRGYILSNQYRKAKMLMRDAAIHAAAITGWTHTDGPVSVHVAVREPDRRRRDLNFQKAMLDGITESGAIWEDDRQVRLISWEFTEITKAQAGATITVCRRA